MKPARSAEHKRKRFVEHYLLHNNATKAAIAAGYSKKGADVAGCRLLGDVRVHAIIEAFKAKEADSAIMDIAERKRTLSEIGRARLTHFGTAGVDGFVLNVGPENLNSAGIEAIKTRTEITGQGGKDEDKAIVSEIKLRCPIKAIDLLNKMDGIYVERQEVTVTSLGDLLDKINGKASKT